MQNMANKDKKGFTMPELMVLLLALSIMFAAAAPIISKRQPSLASNELPAGSILIWCEDEIPNDYTNCDGSVAPNGMATPNLVGTFPIGAGNSTNYAWNSTGGSATHTLIIGELPSHNHDLTITSDPHTHTATVVSNSHTHTSVNTTSATTHKHTMSVQLASLSGSPAAYRFFNAAGANYTANPASYFVNQLPTIYLDWQTSPHAHSGTSNTPSAGDHTHAVVFASAGDHTHALSGASASIGDGDSFGILPKYRACYYIMKYR